MKPFETNKPKHPKILRILWDDLIYTTNRFSRELFDEDHTIAAIITKHVNCKKYLQALCWDLGVKQAMVFWTFLEPVSGKLTAEEPRHQIRTAAECTKTPRLSPAYSQLPRLQGWQRVFLRFSATNGGCFEKHGGSAKHHLPPCSDLKGKSSGRRFQFQELSHLDYEKYDSMMFDVRISMRTYKDQLTFHLISKGQLESVQTSVQTSI